MDPTLLIQAALQARERCYAPYSRFGVGAALLTQGGKVYTGCNIENAAYSPSICAERTALFSAVARGERDFQAMAIVGGPLGQQLEPGNYCAPCGVCRQALLEFCSPEEFLLYLATGPQDYQAYTLSQLVPLPFGPWQINPSP